jgi:hypothetical protein
MAVVINVGPRRGGIWIFLVVILSMIGSNGDVVVVIVVCHDPAPSFVIVVVIVILRKRLAVRAAIGTAAGEIHCLFIFGALTVLSVREGVRSLDVGFRVGA